MLKQILAATFCAFICSAALADDGSASTATSSSLSVTGPQEVGTTSMPPGNYQIKEKTTGRMYELMVSNKGTMILAPAPEGAAAAAATSASAAVAPAAGTPASAQNSLTNLGTNALKRMVQDQVTKGVTNVIEKDATNSFSKFMK